jgi:Leucine-rich repeat (LRR) protein
LTKLAHLEVTSGKLTSVQIGSVHADLVHLNLSANAISDLDGQTFEGNRGRVEVVDLCSNNLTTIGEGEFSNMTALKVGW